MIGACRVISNPAACQKPLSCTYLWSASPYFPVGCPPWLCCHGHRSSLSVTRLVALSACLVKELEFSPWSHILPAVSINRQPITKGLSQLLPYLIVAVCIGPCGPSRGKPSSAGTILDVPEFVSRLSMNSKYRALLSSSGDKGTETFLINATL